MPIIEITPLLNNVRLTWLSDMQLYYSDVLYITSPQAHNLLDVLNTPNRI